MSPVLSLIFSFVFGLATACASLAKYLGYQFKGFEKLQIQWKIFVLEKDGLGH